MNLEAEMGGARFLLSECRRLDDETQRAWSRVDIVLDAFCRLIHYDCDQSCFECEANGPPEEMSKDQRTVSDYLTAEAGKAWDAHLKQRHVTVRAEKMLRELERANGDT